MFGPRIDPNEFARDRQRKVGNHVEIPRRNQRQTNQRERNYFSRSCVHTNEKKTNAKKNPELHTRNECKNKEEEEDYVLGRRDSETLEIEKTEEKNGRSK